MHLTIGDDKQHKVEVFEEPDNGTEVRSIGGRQSIAQGLGPAGGMFRLLFEH